MNVPVCITFAGCVGSSKTPIAHALSTAFDLPIHDNDTIRTEVAEDLGRFDEQEYLKRRDARLSALIGRQASFICGASVDRQWSTLRDGLQRQGYEWFIISLDWSRDLLTRLYRAKGYDDALAALETYWRDHEVFLETYGSDVSLRLTDPDFPERLAKARDAVGAWLAKRG